MKQRYKPVQHTEIICTTEPEEKIKQGYKIHGRATIIPTLRGKPNYEMHITYTVQYPTIFTVYRCDHLSPYYVEAAPLYSGTEKQCERYLNTHGGDGITELFTEPKNAAYIQ